MSDEDGWVIHSRARATIIKRKLERFRAACPCGWQAEGYDEVRGEALVHGYHCAGT